MLKLVNFNLPYCRHCAEAQKLPGPDSGYVRDTYPNCQFCDNSNGFNLMLDVADYVKWVEEERRRQRGGLLRRLLTRLFY